MFVHKREVEEAISKMPEVAKAQMVLTLSGHKDVITFRVELKDEVVNEDAFRQAFVQACFKLAVSVNNRGA